MYDRLTYPIYLICLYLIGQSLILSYYPDLEIMNKNKDVFYSTINVVLFTFQARVYYGLVLLTSNHEVDDRLRNDVKDLMKYGIFYHLLNAIIIIVWAVTSDLCFLITNAIMFITVEFIMVLYELYYTRQYVTRQTFSFNQIVE